MTPVNVTKDTTQILLILNVYNVLKVVNTVVIVTLV